MDVNHGVKIWVIVNRVDLGGTPSFERQAATPVLLPQNTSSAEVQQAVRKALQLKDETLVLKLRNSRGSLIPINSHVTSNSKFMPYTLEVVQRYQHIKPMPRSVKLNGFSEITKVRLQKIMRRLEQLERSVPELRNRREEKIKQEMEELNEKMKFLNKRMQEAEGHKWKGMFKKHPLW
ncbi:uncharacterized protein LOC110988206 [Acanthaster planci]|uniref:Uncharacterized protein LOC110988206 n=1 Tax=Acanthaster planci TaxID=133434 RepID=A0A8B7ZQR0_ACAPL|nr:uncharacterized protein LOC110988206 [Acanthaster planci]